MACVRGLTRGDSTASHADSPLSIARPTPSNGGAERADVKRAWWCISFPATRDERPRSARSARTTGGTADRGTRTRTRRWNGTEVARRSSGGRKRWELLEVGIIRERAGRSVEGKTGFDMELPAKMALNLEVNGSDLNIISCFCENLRVWVMYGDVVSIITVSKGSIYQFNPIHYFPSTIIDPSTPSTQFLARLTNTKRHREARCRTSAARAVLPAEALSSKTSSSSPFLRCCPPPWRKSSCNPRRTNRPNPLVVVAPVEQGMSRCSVRPPTGFRSLQWGGRLVAAPKGMRIRSV